MADLMQPPDPDFFELVPVSDKVNKVANTGPDIQAPVVDGKALSRDEAIQLATETNDIRTLEAMQMAENGAFIVLDVPPMSATLGFNVPGAETARVVLRRWNGCRTRMSRPSKPK